MYCGYLKLFSVKIFFLFQAFMKNYFLKYIRYFLQLLFVYIVYYVRLQNYFLCAYALAFNYVNYLCVNLFKFFN